VTNKFRSVSLSVSITVSISTLLQVKPRRTKERDTPIRKFLRKQKHKKKLFTKKNVEQFKKAKTQNCFFRKKIWLHDDEDERNLGSTESRDQNYEKLHPMTSLGLVWFSKIGRQNYACFTIVYKTD